MILRKFCLLEIITIRLGELAKGDIVDVSLSAQLAVGMIGVGVGNNNNIQQKEKKAIKSTVNFELSG